MRASNSPHLAANKDSAPGSTEAPMRLFTQRSRHLGHHVATVLVSVSSSLGLPALAALVFGESAGLPIPGETALIVAGGLAAAGHLSLPAVIVVAAIAATTGDMLGYWIGRRGGRKLLLRDGRFSAHRRAAVEKADRYFDRYGVVTVFFARFVPGVRVVGALAAGATEMRWRSFAIANMLGCLTWATTVASFAYVAGPEGSLVLVALGLSVATVGFVATVLKARREQGELEAALAAMPVAADQPPASVHEIV